MNTAIEAAVTRLRLACDSLRLLNKLQTEVLREAGDVLAEAKEAVGALSPRRIIQVAAGADGDVLALTTDGVVWRCHSVKGDDYWSPLNSIPSANDPKSD